MNAWPDVKDLIAHREPMLLLSRVVGFGDGSLQAEYDIDPAAWYAEAGAMPCWVGIEVMAQAVAAYVGMESRARGDAIRQGVLLGTRSFKSDADCFYAAAPLGVTVSMQFRDESGLGAFDCTLSQGGVVVAQATLTVFEPADFKRFMEAA